MPTSGSILSRILAQGSNFIKIKIQNKNSNFHLTNLNKKHWCVHEWQKTSTFKHWCVHEWQKTSTFKHWCVHEWQKTSTFKHWCVHEWQKTSTFKHWCVHEWQKTSTFKHWCVHEWQKTIHIQCQLLYRDKLVQSITIKTVSTNSISQLLIFRWNNEMKNSIGIHQKCWDDILCHLWTS